MFMFWISFIVGLVICGCIGMAVCWLLMVAREADEEIEKWRNRDCLVKSNKKMSCPGDFYRSGCRRQQKKLRLLWELSEQGYEIDFSTQGEEIICRLQCGEKESSAVSNNASSALYVARHNFKQLWGE